MSKKEYFPNNWRAIQQSPDEWFPSMPAEAFMDWKVHGYMIPDSVCCMIRETEKDGTITERIYQSAAHGQNRVRKCMQENKEIVLCTMEGMWHLKPDDIKPLDFNNEQ
jgi:hypothetical protein|tara:strand:+ start:213 stop:536 length:324 start_codon:yes stop_codon:yes gene_type:complete